MNATKELFPRSSASTIIRLTESIAEKWWVGQAQAAFSALRETIIDSHNSQLRARYDELRDNFQRRIDSIERTFRDSALAQNIVRQIAEHWARREFRDENHAIAQCRLLIKAAGLVETDHAVIRRRTQNGFGRLCEIIRRIYLGMREGPGDNRMWYASSPQEYMSAYRTGPAYRLVRRRSDERWILAHAWQMEATHRDAPWWSKDPDTTYVVRVSQSETPLRLANTFRGTPIDLAAAERRMDQAS